MRPAIIAKLTVVGLEDKSPGDIIFTEGKHHAL